MCLQIALVARQGEARGVIVSERIFLELAKAGQADEPHIIRCLI